MDHGRASLTLVLDASVALAWIFERAAPAEAVHATAVLAELKNRPAIVPALWHIEIANALATALRRDVISVSKATDFLARLDRLPITTDDAPVAERREHVFARRAN